MGFNTYDIALNFLVTTGIFAILIILLVYVGIKLYKKNKK